MQLRYLRAVIIWSWAILGLNTDHAQLHAATASASTQSLKDGLEAYRLGQFRHAHTLLEPLAVAGEAQAQFTLAMMSSGGHGGELDEYRAAHWLGLAAAQGHRDAEYFFAQIHEQGWGIAKSQDQAIHWYQRCAAQADPRCRARLEQLQVAEPVVSAPVIIEVATATPTPPPLPVAEPSSAPIPAVGDGELLGDTWVRAQNPNNYTILLLTSAKEQDLHNYVSQYHLPGDIAIVPETRRGQILYNLIYGSYETSTAANQVRAILPLKVAKANPKVRRLRSLRLATQN